MKKQIFLLLTVVSMLSSCATDKKANTWGDELNRYVIESYMPSNKYVWNWNEAIFLKAAIERCENNIATEQMFAYVREAMEHTMGDVNGLHPNAVASGFGMAYLAQATGEEIYKEKAFDVYKDYCNIPRSTNGGISHREEVIELWDDTVYMVSEFLMQMYKLTGDEKFLKEAIFQINAHAEKLEDPETGLWYHGWDNDSISTVDPCCLLGWADNPYRRNNEFWGRGNGWITMTLVNILELMPKQMSEYKQLKEKYLKMMNTLAHVQDQKNGHWYQLPVYPGEEGNFIESSCTAMFAYAITAGIRNGLLPADTYLPVVERAYNGLQEHSLMKKGEYLVMKNVCAGTCIGDKDYYYNRKVVNDRPFGYGVAIMFYDQYQLLKAQS